MSQQTFCPQGADCFCPRTVPMRCHRFHHPLYHHPILLCLRKKKPPRKKIARKENPSSDCFCPRTVPMPSFLSPLESSANLSSDCSDLDTVVQISFSRWKGHRGCYHGRCVKWIFILTCILQLDRCRGDKIQIWLICRQQPLSLFTLAGF